MYVCVCVCFFFFFVNEASSSLSASLPLPLFPFLFLRIAICVDESDRLARQVILLFLGKEISTLGVEDYRRPLRGWLALFTATLLSLCMCGIPVLSPSLSLSLSPRLLAKLVSGDTPFRLSFPDPCLFHPGCSSNPITCVPFSCVPLDVPFSHVIRGVTLARR